MLADLRPFIFIFLLAFFILIQHFKPFSKDRESIKRFVQNLSHVVLSQIVVAAFFLIVGISFSVFSDSIKLGLFHLLQLPFWLRVLLTFIGFDLALYLQHRASHRWTWLWNIHRLHHSDKALTTSTAVRFHFTEILISALWKGVVLVLLGATLEHFIWFEIYLSSCALFNHSNLAIPEKLNQFLEKFLVTPKIHRVHHSIDLSLTHSNFGFSVVIWDKLFKTFNKSQDVPEVGVAGLNLESFKSQVLLKEQ